MFRPHPEPDHFASVFDCYEHRLRRAQGNYQPNARADTSASRGDAATCNGQHPPQLIECERCSFTIVEDDPKCGHCGLEREGVFDIEDIQRAYNVIKSRAVHVGVDLGARPAETSIGELSDAQRAAYRAIWENIKRAPSCGCPESRLCDGTCKCDCPHPEEGWISEDCPIHGPCT